MSKVINLSGYFGSPSEISLKADYSLQFGFTAPGIGYYSFIRDSDTSVVRLAEFIELLSWYDQCGEGLAWE